jgi:hypothetical protein
MSRPLDERYFDWLYDQVGSGPDEKTGRKYLKVLELMFFHEFVWIIPNDDNRAEDGRDLRREFLNEKNIRHVDDDWLRIGCSMLELFIALSRVLAFEAEGEPRDWFWVLMRNLGLTMYSDDRRMTKRVREDIEEILDDVIWRTYHPNGQGGLFPLHYPHEDQRDVEIWYQLNAYLLEREAA